MRVVGISGTSLRQRGRGHERMTMTWGLCDQRGRGSMMRTQCGKGRNWMIDCILQGGLSVSSPFKPTEMRFILCTRFGEFCSCCSLRENAPENEPHMLRWGRPIFAKIAPGVGLGLKTHQATIFLKIFGGKFEFWSVFGRFSPIFLKLWEAIWGAKNEFRRGFNAFL